MKTVGIGIGFPEPRPGLGFLGFRTQGSATLQPESLIYAALAESSGCRSLAQIASIKDGGFMGSLDMRTPTAA